ncbi:MAG: glycosyltransferase [Comamonadaceae bacterium]|nr:MAG: glycosyltransferase [Comamonadaceae bacterium]
MSSRHTSPSRARVLLLRENAAIGGVNAMVDELRGGLQGLGWESLHVQTLSGCSIPALLRAAWRCDAIVATNNFRTAYVGWALGQLFRRPCVVWVHGPLQQVLSQAPASRAKLAVLRQLYRRVAFYVFNSMHTQQSFEAALHLPPLPPGRACVIPNAVQRPRAPRPVAQGVRADSAGPQPVELGYVGRLAAEKAPQRLIDMLRVLPPHYRLTLVGDGPLRAQLQAESADLQADGRLVFAGERARHHALDPAWHMTVLASRYEGGCPLSALESAAAGIPFVAPPLPALLETVCGAAGPLLASDDTPSGLAQAVLRVRAMPLADLQRALDAVLGAHGSARFAAQWQDVLKQVLR